LIREQQQTGLVVAVFCESHSAGHQFWKYRKSSDQPNDRTSELSNATRTIYEAIDEEMGLLLRELPADSNVVVLSSVGLRDHYPTGRLLESFCRTLGYQVPVGNGAKPSSFHPLSILRQRIPEAWRIGLSRRFSREMRERLLASQFRSSTDWTRTTAFVIPSIYTGFVQVNLRGREPDGIVEPGQEYESILQRLESDLAQLIDPITGQRAVERVVRTKDVFGPDAPSRMPDLIVHWQPVAHFVSRVIHPKGELVQVPSEFNRGSDHYERGFFAAAGPSIINAGQLPNIDVLNLAPTFLSLLGRSPAPWMSGQALESVVQRQAADSLV